MKIRKIQFKNIHSLKGEHSVDFSSGVLADAGLFAITGPTGSGKSTLLDVITLALYNKIPRIDKAISNSILEEDGGIMTRNAKDCYAEVEYSVRGNIYRSHWSIERNRNNNLKDRKLELTEVGSGKILDAGRTTVPKRNEEIIGLSYDQFVKAMVLSQGQFSKLLKASRDERNKLLEDITGAKAYREIGKAVFAKYTKAKKAKEEQELKIGEIVLIPEVEKRNLKNELAELEKSSPVIKKKYDASTENILVRNNRIKQAEQYNVNLKQKEVLDRELTTFEEKKLALVKHNELVKYREFIKEKEQNSKELSSKEKQKKENAEKYEQAGIAKQNIVRKINELIGGDCDEENVLSELELFRTKIIALQEKVSISNTEANLHKVASFQHIQELEKLEVVIDLKDTPDALYEEVLREQEEVNKKMEASGEKELNALVEKASKLRDAIETANELKAIFKTYIAGEKLILKNSKELENGVELVQTSNENAIKLNKEWQLLEKEVTALIKEEEQKRKLKSLEEHRKELKEDEECPLCGSLEHPYAKHIPVFDVQADYLETKRKLLEKTKRLEVAEITKSKLQLTNNEKLKAEIEATKKQTALYAEEVNLLANKLKWEKPKEITVLDVQLTELKEKLKVCVQSEAVCRAKMQITHCLKSVTEWKIKSNIREKVITEIKKQYQGINIDKDAMDLNKEYTIAIEDIKNLSKIGTELKNEGLKLSKLADQFKTNLEAVLVKENIKSVEYLKELILEENIAEGIRVQWQKNEEKKTSLETTLRLNLKSLTVLKEKDDEKISLEELNEIMSAAEIEWKELENKTGVITQKLESNQQSRERHKEGLMKLELLKKEEGLWKTMNNLIGDANGKKFSNFVQDLTLEQLIGYANMRLKELSDRYVLDIPTAHEADKNDSLKVFDTYMGDARRSVNTLSGGETFMVSLAMAFALSDLAAKNVNIESIFIDEGFGTLDPDTLDDAISILEKMQNEGEKSIGVISHVEALKGRINTQIKLEKSGAGYSTIKIE